MNKIKHPSPFIYLTGLPRSGSTWAAAALTAATHARLIHEPFNWLRYPRREKFHMHYLPAGSYAPDLIHILNKTLHPNPITQLKDQIPNLPSTPAYTGVRRLPSTVSGLRSAVIGPPSAVLLKDVHTCLALPYICEIYQPHVVILLRHPCGMAQSWQRLDLAVDFRLDLLLDQKALRDQWLASFTNHLSRRDNYFFMLGAYWGAAHYLLEQIGRDYPAWQWVTHEVLCQDPAGEFRELPARLGLETLLDESALDRFLNENDRQRTAGEGAHSVARVTAEEPDKWRQRLRPEEIQAVLAGAAPFGILERYFPEDTA